MVPIFCNFRGNVVENNTAFCSSVSGLNNLLNIYCPLDTLWYDFSGGRVRLTVKKEKKQMS